MSGTEHEISELLTALSKTVVAPLSFFAAFGFRRADVADTAEIFCCTGSVEENNMIITFEMSLPCLVVKH